MLASVLRAACGPARHPSAIRVYGVVRVHQVVVAKQRKSTTKTPSGTRDVYLLPAARAALEAQKAHTFLAGARVFHNARTGKPWDGDKQIRVIWQFILKAAGVRYRCPYQCRHTPAPCSRAARTSCGSLPSLATRMSAWCAGTTARNGFP